MLQRLVSNGKRCSGDEEHIKNNKIFPAIIDDNFLRTVCVTMHDNINIFQAACIKTIRRSLTGNKGN